MLSDKVMTDRIQEFSGFQEAGGRLLAVAAQVARDAGAFLLEQEGRVSYRKKGARDLVTDADLGAQQMILEGIRGEFPDHGFLGEEGDAIDADELFSSKSHVWVVDPLDGTTNFVHNMPHYGVSVALMIDGQPHIGVVYQPHRDELFQAVAGAGAFLGDQRLQVSQCEDLEESLIAISFSAKVSANSIEIEHFLRILQAAQAVRRIGSAALNLAYLASGRFDAYWARNGKIWDVAAGILLVHEAGGVVTGATGEPFDREFPHIIGAATPDLHRLLLELVAPNA